MLIGYARISKADGSQSLDLQKDALREAGVSDDAIYEDQASGQREDRPGLAAFLKAARQGDVIVVWRLDRLGRNLRHLVNLVQDLNDRDIGIRVLAGQGASIDTTDPQRKVGLREPGAAKQNGFQYGRMKVSGKKRAGSGNFKQVLPFVNKTGTQRVAKGWLFPMLAGFRANVRWDLPKRQFEWIVPPETLLSDVIGELVKVCVSEHRDNNLKPEAVGKRESSYRQCYDKVVIHLARKGLLPM